MKLNISFLTVSLLLSLVFFATSCKDPESPKATVTVLNRFDQNKPVPNALVTVFANAPRGKVEPSVEGVETKSGLTDGSGKITFNFDFVNILSVKAEMPVSSGDTLYGIGVLRLEEDKNYEETIYLSQYKSQL